MSSDHAIPAEKRKEKPKHVAIIMDGNGRWAQQRGLPRTAGHKQGVDAVRRTVRAAGDLGLEFLTLYSFSTENWSRPESEVNELFSLLRLFIRRDLADLHKSNVRVLIIGSRSRVPADVLNLLDEAQNLTAGNTGQTLIIAFNYGSRDEIINATRLIAEQVAAGKVSPEQIDEQMMDGFLYTHGVPEPDLLIRTSGEKRLSNFLLWQLAYSEFIFMDCLWPDFGKENLADAIEAYCGRDRRFGGLVRDTAS